MVDGVHVLHVDLGERRSWVEDVEEQVYRQFLGGYGLGAWLMWKHYPAGADPLAVAIVKRERAALRQLPSALATLPTDRIPLKPFNLVGLDALRHLLGASTPAVTDAGPPLVPLVAPNLSALVDDIAAAFRAGHRRIMVSAACGFGKTELATAILAATKANGRRGIFVADRIALVTQTGERFDKYGLDHGIVMADHWRYQIGRASCRERVSSPV